LVVPSGVWRDIALDFVEGFPKVGGKSVILIVVDRFSKYAYFITLGHPYSTMSVAMAFFDTIVWLHGIPESIVSDRDPVFTNMMWKELFGSQAPSSILAPLSIPRQMVNLKSPTR
jgi:hypothetical protein